MISDVVNQLASAFDTQAAELATAKADLANAEAALAALVARVVPPEPAAEGQPIPAGQ